VGQYIIIKSFLFSITIRLVSLRLCKVLLAILTFSNAACSVNNQEQQTRSTITPTVASTLSASPIPVSSETALPPSLSSQPTVPPAEGITSTQVNVRAQPSTSSNVLGIIPPDMRVEIVGKDPGESWWQILYPQAPDGKGWVTSQYITTPIKPEVPIVGGLQADPTNGPFAIIQQKINIRSGPGTSFNSIGTLSPQDAVNVIGKDANGTWLQIEFGAGPEGKGWINAAFVQANGTESLPIVADTGVVVGTGTPTNIPLTSTPTIVPAWEDGDSPTSPIMSIRFEPSRTHTSIYNGDVSAPQGDAQDWIQFTPYTRAVLLEVSCLGNDLDIEVLQNGLAIQRGETIHCGSELVFPTEPNLPVVIHFSARADGPLKYTSYTLHIKTIP
jgi:uncharacterized protein YraI